MLFVVLVLVVYAVCYYPPLQTWWSGLFVAPVKPDPTKVVLPRDGTTTVKGLKHKGSGVTTTRDDLVHPPKTVAKVPRPNPNPISPSDKEVFNISNNVYTYEDAPAVCKAFGSRIATPKEVEAAFKDGADWCNYGWTEGQQALYPTQQVTYDKLQKSEEHAHDCGVVGVNGGYFENPDLEFGVNCYGKKPEPRLHEKDLIGFFPDYISEKERRLQERVQAIRENLDDVVVLPYNREQWDESRTVMERVDDWVRPDKAKEATEYVAA